MVLVARLLQIVALIVPPLAIIAELNHTISLGQMLGFLVFALCLFYFANVIQARTGGE